jgi:hypothetical protein
MSTTITFESFRQEWLADVTVGNPSTTELGNRFAHKMFKQWLDIDDSSDDLVYCDGAGDGGIDIAYLYRGEGDAEEDGGAEGHTWYLVQSKYGRAFRGTGTILEEAQKVIDTLDGKRQNLSSLVTDLLERLLHFRKKASDRDRIVMVLATEEELDDAQKRALNDVRAMGRGRLGPMFDVEAVSIATIYQRTLDEPSAVLGYRHSVPFKGNLVASGKELLVGSVPLLALYDFLKAYRTQTEDLDQLYEKNVRRFLGSRGKVNKAMQQTLRDKPDRFGLYNNGITIVVADFRPESDGSLTLMDPYVVNGCQTSRTIWEVFHKRLEAGGTGTDSELDAWRQKAGQGVVVTKVVKVGVTGEDLLQEITRYTNSQNAVRERDFLALTSDFRTWANQMAARNGVFLEVQRGGWDSQRGFQKQNPSARQFAKSANAFDLIKVYGAGWLGEAGTAFGRNAAFVPNGTIYQKIMKNEEGEAQFSVDDLYAAYQLQVAADGYEFGRKAAPTRRQTRYLFYMAFMELLKGVMVRAGMPPTSRNMTQAVLKLFNAGKEDVAKSLLDAAVELIDDYMTSGTEDSILAEPAIGKRFNNDINGYLKWEQLGKTDEASPHFRSQISGQMKVLSKGGATSDREKITAVIKDTGTAE